jgi:hypothetical protein
LRRKNALSLAQSVMLACAIDDNGMSTVPLRAKGEFESLPWRKRHDAKVNKTSHRCSDGRIHLTVLQAAVEPVPPPRITGSNSSG